MRGLGPGEGGRGEGPGGTERLLGVGKGEGGACMDGGAHALCKGRLLLVPAALRHTLRNSGDKPLRFVTFYAPPQHAAGTVHATRADALSAERAELKKPRGVAAGKARAR